MQNDQVPKRREGDYRHMRPIDDMLLALFLLRSSDRRTPRRLMTLLYSDPHYIELMICNGGYTREDHASSYYYPVTNDLSSELKRAGYVEGTKQWGYTDNNECILTDHGKQTLHRMTEEFEGEVIAFLAKEHPDITWEERSTIGIHLRLVRLVREFDDFFIALSLNGNNGEVRRTRGVFTFVPAE